MEILFFFGVLPVTFVFVHLYSQHSAERFRTMLSCCTANFERWRFLPPVFQPGLSFHYIKRINDIYIQLTLASRKLSKGSFGTGSEAGPRDCAEYEQDVAASVIEAWPCGRFKQTGLLTPGPPSISTFPRICLPKATTGHCRYRESTMQPRS